MEHKDDKQVKERKFNYFVDAEKFEAEESTITGALIKLKLPEAKRSYALYLEGQGNDFHTVPPASFGI
jgi:hypothetical protein